MMRMIRCCLMIAKCMCAALCVALCVPAASLAETARQAAVQCDPFFALQSAEVASDGTLWLAGSTGKPADQRATLLNADLAGNVLWSKKDDDKSWGLYRHALPLNEDTVIALRSAPQTDIDYVVEFLKGGEIVSKTKKLADAFFLAKAPDGFYMYCVPKSGTSRIWKTDAAGKSVWKIDWKESIHFENILTSANFNVAFGNKTTVKNRMELGPTSVVVAFDDQGKILWRTDSDGNEELYNAAWTEEGDIVLVGAKLPPDLMPGTRLTLELAEGRKSVNTITKLGRNGEVIMRKEYTNQEIPFYFNDTISLISTQHGLLLASADQHEGSAIRLFLLDTDGSILKEWQESIGRINMPEKAILRTIDERIYLISYGKVVPDISEYEGSLGDKANETVITEIHLPT